MKVSKMRCRFMMKRERFKKKTLRGVLSSLKLRKINLKNDFFYQVLDVCSDDKGELVIQVKDSGHGETN